jgi:hypothetical protein
MSFAMLDRIFIDKALTMYADTARCPKQLSCTLTSMLHKKDEKTSPNVMCVESKTYQAMNIGYSWVTVK